jgi:hypothetical protein
VGGDRHQGPLAAITGASYSADPWPATRPTGGRMARWWMKPSSAPHVESWRGLAARPSRLASFEDERPVPPGRKNFLFDFKAGPAGGRLRRPSSRRQRHDGYPEAGLAERCRLEVRSRS